MATKDLSVGKPWKVILLFALPMIISVTLQQVYNIADSMIAGKMIGNSALAAVSASYPITMVFLALATGAGVGTSVVVSRYFGMKNYKDVKTSISTALITFLSFALILGIIGIFTSKFMLKMIRTDSVILDLSNTYLVVYCYGMVFLFLYNVVTFIFQALGNSKTPLYFLIFSTSLNVILDIVFAKVGMGVLGIALATLIAQGIASILSLLWLIKSLSHIESEKAEIYSKQLIKTILRIALPTMIQTSIIAIGGVIVQSEINSYGGAVTAGYGAAYKVCYIIINIILTMSNALSSYVSQNIGAGKIERVGSGLKSTFLIAFSFAILCSIIYLIFAEQLVNLFLDKTKIDAGIDMNEIMNTGITFIRVVSPFYCVISVKIAFDGVLKGSGDMRNFMIATFVDLALRVGLTYLFSYLIGLNGIWWSWPIGWGIAAIVEVALYFTYRWKKINTKEESVI